MHVGDGIIKSLEKHVKHAQAVFGVKIESMFKSQLEIDIYKYHIMDENRDSIPMDFVKVREKLSAHQYRNIDEYHQDMQRYFFHSFKFYVFEQNVEKSTIYRVLSVF